MLADLVNVLLAQTGASPEGEAPARLVAAIVYVLCAATSGLAALLLLRSYFNRGVRLLLWSGLCFVGLTVDNVVLFVDEVIIPDIPLALVRKLGAVAGLALLIYGLIWDVK